MDEDGRFMGGQLGQSLVIVCQALKACGDAGEGQIARAPSAAGGNAQQGALFALECLAERLGLLFEPYVVAVVPALLKVCSKMALQLYKN
jgi:hypothetical protein